jgi:surfactin synthase thioesterase subunit
MTASGRPLSRNHDRDAVGSGQPATSRLALLCLPHAGGAAAFFRPWRAALSDAAEVVPIEVAGHGARRNEPLPLTFTAALGSIWAAITSHADRRYALFGHSLGALYAFEIARRLTQLGRPPALLVTSGRNGPARSAEIPDCHNMPDNEFVALLTSYGGIPAEIRDDPALMRFFLPTLRADIRIAERYTRAGEAVLRCPVTVFFGARDPLVSAAGVAAWRRETTADCEIARLPGGHFCLRESYYLGRLREALSRHITAPAS